MPKRRRPERSPTSKSPGRVRLGIDLGGSNVRVVLLGPGGRVLAQSGRRPHRNDGPAPVLRATAAVVQDLLGVGPAPVETVGFAIAAQVDGERGTVVHAPNLGWRNVPVARVLGRLLRRPVRLINDARAATYAEWSLGAGRGCDNLFGLMAGTGIGGSMVAGGVLLEGATNAAGEVGHIPIVSGGRRCTCPGRGCFEAYAGGWGIAERAREAARADPMGARRLVEASHGVGSIRAADVFEAAGRRDPFARRLVTETEGYFADGIVGIVNAFNPSRVVLNGGLITGWPRLVGVAARAVRRRCQPPAARARIVLGRWGDLAPAVGAAAWAPRPE